MGEKLTLFTVTDGNKDDDDPFYEDWECGAYWAKSKESAGEQGLASVPPGYDDVIPFAVSHSEIACDVTEDGEERRLEVLRLAGFGIQGESACDVCGFFANVMAEYAVCPECYTCVSCSDGTCEYCNGSEAE